MDRIFRQWRKNPCYSVSLILLAILSLYMAFRLARWATVAEEEEFIPTDGLRIQYGGAMSEANGGRVRETNSGRVREANGGRVRETNSGRVRETNSGSMSEANGTKSQKGGGVRETNADSDPFYSRSFREANALGRPLESITDSISISLRPEGGQSVDEIVGMEEQFKSTGCRYGYNKLNPPDQVSLAAAHKAAICKNKPNCVVRDDWNYVARAAVADDSVSYLINPQDPKQSEFYSQFFRDVQNNLAEHSVENFRYPSSSTLTSSYRNSAQYCGIGKTVDKRIPHDRCFDPIEYQNFYNRNQSAPDVINTQIKPYNRRLRSQIRYNPVNLYDEIIPANGFLNEKPANFTSEHTRTFDWFTSAGLGHVDYLY